MDVLKSWTQLRVMTSAFFNADIHRVFTWANVVMSSAIMSTSPSPEHSSFRVFRFGGSAPIRDL